jgi:AcrR family transcriptional regulator
MEFRSEMPKSSKQAAVRLPPEQIVDRLVAAAMQLLAEKGPSEIKARSVAESAQVSTIALYYHLGGMPELFQAVVDKGFSDLTHAFGTVACSTDPVTDLFSMALTSRRIAQSNPHLYDLMFGLSTRGSYRPLQRSSAPSGARSGAFPAAYSHLVQACGRLLTSGRIRGDEDPEIVASQLWSSVHGFVTLELADHFVQFADPVRQVLLPTTVNLLVGLGDNAGLCRASHTAAFARLSEDNGDTQNSRPFVEKATPLRRKSRTSR